MELLQASGARLCFQPSPSQERVTAKLHLRRGSFKHQVNLRVLRLFLYSILQELSLSPRKRSVTSSRLQGHPLRTAL